MNRKTFLILLAVVFVVAMLAVPVAALAADSSSLTTSAAQSTLPATRAEFAQLALEALGLPPVYPPSPTFTDVPPDNPYYGYVEGAAAAGLIQGLGNGAFGPDLEIAREQVSTILARYLSSIELNSLGYIVGTDGTHYSSLYAWYAAEGEAQLADFSDEATILAVHRPGVAYLAMQGIAQGSDGFFSPLSAVTQAECVALIARVSEAAASFTSEVTTPTVTSLSPSTGPSAGGTTVYVSGTDFSSDSSVTFGGVPASSVSVESSTLIAAVSPAGTPGATVQIAVADSVGTSPDTSASEFTYANDAGPTVTAISPNVGWEGDTVTIYGTGFDGDDLTVYFGGVEAAVTYLNPDQIQVIVPSGTDGTTVPVAVFTDYGSSADTSADYFTYYYPYSVPVITAISPNYGPSPRGTTVYIQGSGFIGDSVVYFGGNEATDILVNSSSLITAISPTGVDGSTVPVSVTNYTGTSVETPADDFSYVGLSAGPTITSISPNVGWEGDAVTIQGTNFDGADLAVYFGGVEAFSVGYISPTELTAIVPPGTNRDTVRVTVVTDEGTSPSTRADRFLYRNNDGYPFQPPHYPHE